MGKVILEFDSIEEQDDIKAALDGWKWKMAMWELDQKLRSVVKHCISSISPNQQPSDVEFETVDWVREEIRRILSEHQIEFE
jgi:hypothetical protein